MCRSRRRGANRPIKKLPTTPKKSGRHRPQDQDGGDRSNAAGIRSTSQPLGIWNRAWVQLKPDRIQPPYARIYVQLFANHQGAR